MSDPNIDTSLFENNRKRFTKLLKSRSVAVFSANDEYPRSGDQFYPYRQQSDLFYLTGINQEETVLLIAPAHPDPKMREILFITETSEQMAVWDGSKLTKAEATRISGIKTYSGLTNLV